MGRAPILIAVPCDPGCPSSCSLSSFTVPHCPIFSLSDPALEHPYHILTLPCVHMQNPGGRFADSSAGWRNRVGEQADTMTSSASLNPFLFLPTLPSPTSSFSATGVLASVGTKHITSSPLRHPIMHCIPLRPWFIPIVCSLELIFSRKEVGPKFMLTFRTDSDSPTATYFCMAPHDRLT
jgi:hypothetical protein